MKIAERRDALIYHWLLRPEEKRTRDDVVTFFGEIRDTRPELLVTDRHADPLQQLAVVLALYIRERR